MIMGHEYSGVVREVGRGVNRRLLGQAVACEPSFGCGTCLNCKNGRISQWAKATRVGGFAERAALPVDCVHPLPKGLDPFTAALAEPASCCLSGLEMFKMPRNATVVVMGGGIMGLLTMAMARRRGAARLILSDPLEERRQIASKLGARVVVDPTRESLHDRGMARTGGRGAEGVGEAVGKAELVGQAFAMVKPTGVSSRVAELSKRPVIWPTRVPVRVLRRPRNVPRRVPISGRANATRPVRRSGPPWVAVRAPWHSPDRGPLSVAVISPSNGGSSCSGARAGALILSTTRRSSPGSIEAESFTSLSIAQPRGSVAPTPRSSGIARAVRLALHSASLNGLPNRWGM